MTLVRLALIACLVACVKPTATVSPRSSYDLYHLCGDSNADGVCASSAERGMLVDTNFAAPSAKSFQG
ncbi:MAG TPA: hypothetical protein VGC41_13395 [Kofleriaceae bacterium]